MLSECPGALCLVPRSVGSVDRGAEVEYASSDDDYDFSHASSDFDRGLEESDSSSEPDYGAGQPEYYEVESDEDRHNYLGLHPDQHPDTDYLGLFD